MIRTLMDAVANINAEGGLDENTPLIEAIKTGNQTIDDMLIKAGAEVDTTNKNGESALTSAKQNHLSVMNSSLKTQGVTETNPLPIKIPMMVLLFFIPFIFIVNIIPALLPNMNP